MKAATTTDHEDKKKIGIKISSIHKGRETAVAAAAAVTATESNFIQLSEFERRISFRILCMQFFYIIVDAATALMPITFYLSNKIVFFFMYTFDSCNCNMSHTHWTKLNNFDGSTKICTRKNTAQPYLNLIRLGKIAAQI